MKRGMALLIAAAMICALASCGSNAGQTQHQPEAETETEDDTLKSLRKTIADSGCQMGVAFLGTMDEGDTNVLQWLQDSGSVERFPFLAGITANEVVTQPGNEMYCIVPADDGTTVTVRTYDPLSSVTPVGQVLYEKTEGTPVCLRGNASDIMPNLEVTVSGENGEAVYQPFISLKDGTVSTETTEGSVYDFTPGEASDAVYFTNLYDEDLDYSDAVGNSGHYTYRVPQLAADTQGAAEINRAISEKYSPIVEDVLRNVSEGVSLSCLCIAWESYEYGEILSLVVSCGWDADVTDYSVYLYDTGSGQQLTTSDLLSVFNVSETAFLDAVRAAAADRFDKQYADVSSDDSFKEAVAERRAWTLSDDNINMDVSAYADAAGTLYVILPIGSIAGADAYEQVLTLDAFDQQANA